MPHIPVKAVETRHVRVKLLFRVRRAISRNMEHLAAQMAAMYNIDATYRLCLKRGNASQQTPAINSLPGTPFIP
jgi:hypothetical protein